MESNFYFVIIALIDLNRFNCYHCNDIFRDYF
jgi:hypothetical protein